MDYQKNIGLLNDMANRYVNSSVVMYGLVANWIPVYKYFIDFKNVFGGNITLNEGKPLVYKIDITRAVAERIMGYSL